MCRGAENRGDRDACQPQQRCRTVGPAHAVGLTRISSPFVIEAIDALAGARQVSVCVYEANGGFLLATPVVLDGWRLSALPTRDAVLPKS